jgi:uncharacterized protein YcsI (UPF0317 family)
LASVLWSELAHAVAPSEFRQQIRSREIGGPTAGYGDDFEQANLTILRRQL